MWLCPSYYSCCPEDEDKTEVLVHGKNSATLLWLKDILSQQTNILILWYHF